MAAKFGSAGRRDQLITFERQALTRRPGGGHAVEKTTLGQAWASVSWVRGGEADRQGALRELHIYRFAVLSAAVEALGLTIKDRIVWNGLSYDIREQPRRLATEPETEIIAEYVNLEQAA